MTVVRWGHFGRPVIIFPTAGGDAEEIERMLVIDALGELIEAGRIKVYSCDSVAGYAMVRGDGDPRYRAAMIDGFHGFVREEMIPAIWADCRTPGAEVIVTGASIGAFNALAVLCRFPEVVSHAIGMSGTYDLEQFIGPDAGDALFFATPLYFLPGLEGPMLGTPATPLRDPGVGRGEVGGHRPVVAAGRGHGRQGDPQPRRSMGSAITTTTGRRGGRCFPTTSAS